MNPFKDRQRWANDYLGRLWAAPSVTLKPLEVPVAALWSRAPPWLCEKARAPMGPLHAALWRFLGDPVHFGTEVLARIPLWVADEQVGYLLDFLIPEFSVNVQIPSWKEEDASTELDFEIDPDNAWNPARAEDLRRAAGIETTVYWDSAVREIGIEETCREIRKDLGFGRPAWLDLYREDQDNRSLLPPPAPHTRA